MEDFPPGFRFYPTEDELVSFYLYNKLQGKREDLNRVMDKIIPVLDIYDFDPSNLPRISDELCCVRDSEQWFFFVPRQESEARGGRPRRLTADGYWKATGSPNNVYSQNRCIGEKRTMVFYRGRAPNGCKTNWKMNEYSLAVQEDQASSSGGANYPRPIRQEFSLCRVYQKSKCVRSYDRRPVDTDRDHQDLTVPDHHHHQTHQGQHVATTSSRGNNTQQVQDRVEERHTIIITRSPDDHDPASTSSSGDQFGIRNNNCTNYYMDISNDVETFLNWDQFDYWFPGGDDTYNMGA